MAFTSGNNPNAVKTALDDVFMPVFNGDTRPEIADATTASVFKQVSISNAAYITEVYKGVGYFGERAELENVNEETPLIGDQQTFAIKNYSSGVTIPKRFFDDEMYALVSKTISDFARKARATRDKNAFGVYRDAFDGTTYTTADGVALISASHVNLNGDTIDNHTTAALSPDSLNDAITALMEQKDQAGVILGQAPATLLVPLGLYKTAVEVTESELLADTAENNKNIYSSKYALRVYTSPFLGSTAGGSNTAWFLLSDNHSVMRIVRQGLTTALRDWKFSNNFSYFYMAEFREQYGAHTYEGIYGSTGAA